MKRTTDMPTVRLFADFQNADPDGRLRLTCNGTLEDLVSSGIQLTEGLHVVVYSDDLEADARVTFSNDERIWVAEIDWKKIRRDE